MNTLESKVQSDMVSSMKSGNKVRTNCLKLLKSAFSEYKTSPNGKREPDDVDLVKIVQKLAKQRKETSELYMSQGREDLATQELAEYCILNEYLPQMLSEDKLAQLVDEYISLNNISSIKSMGQVMGYMNKTYPNQFDGGILSNIVKNKLS